MELENKIKVPTNADAFNLTADLRAMGESTNVIVSVRSTAERDALTKYDGLTVCRLDRWDAPLETWSVNQGGWVDGWTGWYNISLATGVTSQGADFTPRYSRVGQTVFIEGAVKKTSGTFDAGLQLISNVPLPEWVRPGSELYYPGTNDFAGDNTVRVRIGKDGRISAGGPAGVGYIFLTQSYRCADMGAL